MKLKKIASLALAGVMAVSMLAGCKGTESTDTNKGDAQGTVTATSVVSTVEKVVKAYNSKVTINYQDDATFNDAMSKLFSEHSYKELVASSNQAITNELDKFFDTNSGSNVVAMNAVAFTNPTTVPSTQTKIVVLDYGAAYGSALTLAANDFGQQIKNLKNDGYTYTTTSTTSAKIDATADYTVHACTAEKAESNGTVHTFVILVIEAEFKI